MRTEKFKKAIDITERTFQLKMLLRHLEGFFSNKVIYVKIETSICGKTQTESYPFNTPLNTNFEFNKFDADFIIAQIEDRIKKLQISFDNL